jgi:hypothetical protein
MVENDTMKIQVSLLAAGAALLLPSGAVRAADPIPPGTPVTLQFMQDVTTRTAAKDQRIKLRVYTDVVVNGKTLLRQDAPATGIVTKVRKPGRFGKRAELKIRLESVTDASGRRVALESYSSGDRFRAEGPGAAGAGLLVLGPVGLVGGAFIKGNHITIDQGTRIQAKVAGEPDSD